MQGIASTASAHTMLTTVYFPAVIDESLAVAADNTVETRATPVAQALNEIEALTRMPKARIAEDLLGVSTVAYHGWAAGRSLSGPNERRVFGVRDVLARAAVRHQTPERLRAWLVTPVGSRAVSPSSLLKADKIDEARLLAITTNRRRNEPIANWVLAAQPNADTVRSQRRRSVSRSQAASEVAGYLESSDEEDE